MLVGDRVDRVAADLAQRALLVAPVVPARAAGRVEVLNARHDALGPLGSLGVALLAPLLPLVLELHQALDQQIGIGLELELVADGLDRQLGEHLVVLQHLGRVRQQLHAVLERRRRVGVVAIVFAALVLVGRAVRDLFAGRPTSSIGTCVADRGAGRGSRAVGTLAVVVVVRQVQ